MTSAHPQWLSVGGLVLHVMILGDGGNSKKNLEEGESWGGDWSLASSPWAELEEGIVSLG